MKMLRAATAALALGVIALAQPVSAQLAGASSGRFNQPSTAVTVHGRAARVPHYGPGYWPLPGRPGWSPGEYRDREARPGRPGKPDRPRRRSWGWYGGGVGYGGPTDSDGGYFAEGGAEPDVMNGRAAYDYDRGYPYDYYAEPREEHGYAAARRHDRSCETEWTQDRRTRQQVPVRICRN